eukprot:TRINITY_DN1938_c0_g1_i1.p1 TRINITY_DN1938_c0_g1~~TRINITY_DN1938_c0_g1_i1.p1  ORF type:complete len:464 (-),score=129.32 TRINITY_DN1938_c0_g1_i1:17-1408(-)
MHHQRYFDLTSPPVFDKKNTSKINFGDKFGQTPIFQPSHVLFGREKELKTILDFINQQKGKSCIISIYGSQGLGKSSLGRYILNHYRTTYLPLIVDIYDSIENTSITSIKAKRNILEQLLNKCFVNSTLEKFYSSLFVDPTLLLIENCDDEQIAIDLIPKYTDFITIITSRNPINVDIIDLPTLKIKLFPLNIADAAKIVKHRIPHLKKEHCESFAKLCYCLPDVLQKICTIYESTCSSSIINDLAKMSHPTWRSFVCRYALLQNFITPHVDQLDIILKEYSKILAIIPGNFSKKRAEQLISRVDIGFSNTPLEILNKLVDCSILHFDEDNLCYQMMDIFRFFLLSLFHESQLEYVKIEFVKMYAECVQEALNSVKTDDGENILENLVWIEEHAIKQAIFYSKFFSVLSIEREIFRGLEDEFPTLFVSLNDISMWDGETDVQLDFIVLNSFPSSKAVSKTVIP